MTKAKITKPEGYKCRPPDAIGVIVIPCGTVVEGVVADWACSDKAASRVFDPVVEKKVVAPQETKKRGRPKKKD